MRVGSRIALVAVLVFSASFPAFADHFQGDCPLTLVDQTLPATDFSNSPHGTFRNGNLVHVLRGNILTTYTPNDLGDLIVTREDFLGSLAGRETDAGVAFGNGHLFISSEAGLEIFDLRNVRAGGTAPVLVTRRAGLHYRRLAVNGTRLAALYPAMDMPCAPAVPANACRNSIDIFSITTLANPTLVGSISSASSPVFRLFHDVAWNFGFLMALHEGGVTAINVSNPAAPLNVATTPTVRAHWLLSNNTDFLVVGGDQTFETWRISPVFVPFFTRTRLMTIPPYLTIDRANPIRINRQPSYDEGTGRLFTLIEEVNPFTLDPARTIAFAVYDLGVAQFEGAAERIYEDVTFTTDDEVKHNPLPVGSFMYVIGETTGLQSWGACNGPSGQIELESPLHLTCGGAEIHGWVTGVNKIVNVELFLDSTSFGAASINSVPRQNVSSRTPVYTWRVSVNFDTIARGEHILRVIGTDVLGNRKQFASKRMFFGGTGQNCTVPRRRAVR